MALAGLFFITICGISNTADYICMVFDFFSEEK